MRIEPSPHECMVCPAGKQQQSKKHADKQSQADTRVNNNQATFKLAAFT
jgi:hypothetical protein